MEYLWTS